MCKAGLVQLFVQQGRRGNFLCHTLPHPPRCPARTRAGRVFPKLHPQHTRAAISHPAAWHATPRRGRAHRRRAARIRRGTGAIKECECPARVYCRANAAGCAYFPAITRTGGGMMKVRENIRISCAFFYYLYPNALSISGNVVVFPHTTLTTSGRECRHINDFLPRLHLLPLPPGMTTSTSAPPARRSGGISTCTHIQKSAPPPLTLLIFQKQKCTSFGTFRAACGIPVPST